MANGLFNKINFGSGLAVTDEGGGVITVSGGGGPPGATGPAGPTGPTGPAGPGGIPADVVVASGSHLIRNRFASGDTQPAFRLLAEGKLEWGAGGTTASDTALYRLYASTLKTDGDLYTGGSFASKLGQPSQITLTDSGGSPIIYFGDTADANLSRPYANTVKTGGDFYTGGLLATEVGKTSQITLTDSGGSPMILFGSGGDGNLSLPYADYLKTDNNLIMGKKLFVGNSVDGTTAAYGIAFGVSQDTVLYRSAAGVLKTDGALHVVGQIRASTVVAGAVGGAQANKLPIYNSAGTLLGYAPLYAT